MLKSAFLTNVDGVLGPLRLARHTVSLYLCSSGSNAHEASRGSETETRELLWGTEENSISPLRGYKICPLGKSMIFHKKETEKNIELGLITSSETRSTNVSSNSANILKLSSIKGNRNSYPASSCCTMKHSSSCGQCSQTHLATKNVAGTHSHQQDKPSYCCDKNVEKESRKSSFASSTNIQKSRRRSKRQAF